MRSTTQIIRRLLLFITLLAIALPASGQEFHRIDDFTAISVNGNGTILLGILNVHNEDGMTVSRVPALWNRGTFSIPDRILEDIQFIPEDLDSGEQTIVGYAGHQCSGVEPWTPLILKNDEFSFGPDSLDIRFAGLNALSEDGQILVSYNSNSKAVFMHFLSLEFHQVVHAVPVVVRLFTVYQGLRVDTVSPKPIFL